MRDRRSSHLESMNAGRRRRAGAALEDLDSTLDRLEGRLGPAPREDGYDRAARRTAPGAGGDFRRGAALRERAYAGIATEMQALREELRSQMGAGLNREFTALKGEIERALRTPAATGHAAELGAEFERLSAMMHRLSEESDGRQAHLLRLEMEDMKKALGQLAREETVRSFDNRWGELDRRFTDIAGRLSAPRPAGTDPMLKTLAARIEEISGVVGALPTSSTLRSLEDKMRMLQSAVDRFARQQEKPGAGVLDAIGERLDEISRAVAASASLPRAPAFDPEPFERLEARISSLARQVGEATQDTAATRDLSDQLAALSHRVEDLAHRVDVPQRAVERLADQIGVIADRLDHAPALPNLDAVFHGLENRIAAMATRLEQRHEDALAQGRALFHELENRIDDVASRIDAERPAPGADQQFIAAMDARFAELAARFERQAAAAPQNDAGALHALERRLESISKRIESSADAAASDTSLIHGLESQIAELAARVERQAAAAPKSDSGALHALERRLETISNRIESSVGATATDARLIHGLESQIAELASHIARPVARTNDEIEPRLERIERSILESRSDVLEAARRAAEEAVRSFSGSAAESELVAGLAGDLKSLEALTRRSDDRNTKTFEAIHDTLLKIVDRLGTLEGTAARAAPASARDPARDVVLGTARTPSLAPDEMLPMAPAATALATIEAAAPAGAPEAPGRASLLGGLARALSRGGKPAAPQAKAAKAAPATARAAAPSVDPDVPLDPSLVNQPLEPGSGGPDLNAIMRRVRDERGQPARAAGTEASKADFIAAARRAAQAAAAEAEAMKRKPAAKAEAKARGKAADKATDKAAEKAPATSGDRLSFLKNRRKPLLMGIAAILIALAGLQGTRLFLSGEPVAQAPQTDQAAVAALPQTDAAEAEAPRARIAGEASTPSETPPAAAAVPPSEAATADTDWLDLDTTAAAPANEAPAPAATAAAQPAPASADEVAEIEPLPEPDGETLAAIPLDAGPVALREAAASGDPKALYEIGNRYAEGRGVAEDMAKAAQWYEKAAEHGLAPAQYRLGSFYEKGVGVARDVARARHWYQQAAERGNASAMHNLAVLHAMGADGKTDNEAAARWFVRAAELGVRDSQFNLGILSAKGVGMQQNLPEAYKWFALVAKAGDKDAAEKRDEIAGALRPDQLETARAAAELWRAKALDAEANSVEIPESWGESQGTTASVDMRAAVRNIQQILNRSGYQAGSEDGVMGQKTKTAIAAFQKANGMAATGEVDEALVRALIEKR